MFSSFSFGGRTVRSIACPLNQSMADLQNYDGIDYDEMGDLKVRRQIDKLIQSVVMHAVFDWPLIWNAAN